MVLALTLVLALIATLIGVREYKKSEEYWNARQLEESGDAARAYAIYESLGPYREAAVRARTLLDTDPALPLKDAKKGEIVSFGSFEQDGVADNGAEPLKWIVLDKIDGRLLLLALDSIAARPYHRVPFEDVTWGKSDLRQWMNTTFLDEAFSGSQQSLLVPHDTTDLDTPDAAGTPSNPEDSENEARDETKSVTQEGTPGDSGIQERDAPEGSVQADRVFALSRIEADIYLNNDVTRSLLGAARISDAAADPALPIDEDGRADWWLRSRGHYGFTAQFVDRSGAPYAPGANVDAVYAVRPAVWVDPARGKVAS